MIFYIGFNFDMANSHPTTGWPVANKNISLSNNNHSVSQNYLSNLNNINRTINLLVLHFYLINKIFIKKVNILKELFK